ncbi:LPS assembly protein LptD [Candidatus Uabimicrobium sp. HlEnr_7]|uniref:LPS assembly protein LptD n=1 Tax=Candidatus Uabimicrobium helgolandensis TaxID=3095367 RepID=UPI003557A5F5
MKNIIVAFVLLTLIYGQQESIAQDSTKKKSQKTTKTDKWVKLLGEPASSNPEKLPLNMDFGAVEMQEYQGKNVWVLTEGVHLWQETVENEKPKTVLELYSESAVIWFPGEKQSFGEDSKKVQVKNALIYAEGNVHFFWGNKTLRSKAMFFDTSKQTGVLTESIVRGTREQTPLFLRAQTLRIHSKNHIEAHNADISTCQFGEPHYHFSVDHLEMRKNSERSYIVSEENTLYAQNTPIFYIPYIAGHSLEDFPLRNVRVGSSSRFGNHLLTLWGGELYRNKQNWLQSMNWDLNLDVYEERGFGIGPGFNYEGDSFLGFFKTYYVHDQPLRELGNTLDGDPLDEEEATFEILYRFYWQHRHQLPNDWFLDIELSHISDEELLFDFFENEAREEKEQETYAHLKKVWKNHGVTFLASANLNDFQEQIVFLPRGTYHLIKQQLFLDKWGGGLYYSTDVELANVRREDDEQNRSQFDGERIIRFDSIHTLNYKISAGGIQFVPFLEGRSTYFEKSIDNFNEVRGVFSTGAEISTNFYRLFYVENSLLDIHQLLHVFTPQVRYEFLRTTIDSNELIPFNAVEEVDDLQQVTLRLINRLRTVRESGSDDFFLLELELSYLPEEQGGFREQLSNLEIDLVWNIRNNLRLIGNAEYDFQVDGLDVLSSSLISQPLSNLFLSLDFRYQRDNNFITTYRVRNDFNEKWGFEISQQFDFDGDETLRESNFTVRRIFHRFAFDISLEIDNVDDEVGVSFSILPMDFGSSGGLFVPKQRNFTNVYR